MMKFKNVLGRIAPIAIVVVSIITYVTSRQSPKTTPSVPAGIVSEQPCLGDSEMSKALQTLSYGPSYEDHQRAFAFLKATAEHSPNCRKQVIARLMSAMDQPNLDLTGATRRSDLWHYGTRLLGELKAIESLDYLVANFQPDSGSWFPLIHDYAVSGVIDMGEVALPKMQAVLKESPNREIRHVCSLLHCLDWRTVCGTNSARRVAWGI